jgi:hypothetical protein
MLIILLGRLRGCNRLAHRAARDCLSFNLPCSSAGDMELLYVAKPNNSLLGKQRTLTSPEFPTPFTLEQVDQVWVARGQTKDLSPGIITS